MDYCTAGPALALVRLRRPFLPCLFSANAFRGAAFRVAGPGDRHGNALQTANATTEVSSLSFRLTRQGAPLRAAFRERHDLPSDEGPQGDGKEAPRKRRRRRRAWTAKGQVPDQDLEPFVYERRGKLPTAKAKQKLKEEPPRLSSGLTSLLHVHQTLLTDRQPAPVHGNNPFLEGYTWAPPLAKTPKEPFRGSDTSAGADAGEPQMPDLATLSGLAGSAASPALVAAVQEARIRALGSDDAAFRPVPLGPAQIPVPEGGWGRLHVVGGTLGRRRLMMPRGGGVRPMMAKVKEALFDMLRRMGVFGFIGEPHLRVLDLFSGSGALSIEAFSRGAQRALLTDSSLDSCEAAAVNVKYCGVADRSCIVRASVEELLLAPERFANLPDRLVQQTQLLRRIRGICEDAKKTATASPPVGLTANTRLLKRLVEEAATTERELGKMHTYGLVFLCPPYTKVVYKDLIQLLLDCCIVGDDAIVAVEYPKEIGCLPYVIKSDTSSAGLVGLRNRAYGRTCIAVYCKQKLFSVTELNLMQFAAQTAGDRGGDPLSGRGAGQLGGNSEEAHGGRSAVRPRAESSRAAVEVSDTQAARGSANDDEAATRERLPMSSQWCGEERPHEFVPLGMRRQQLVAEGWIKGRKRARGDKTPFPKDEKRDVQAYTNGD
ncbi:hypothetical protein BESB_038090 [Besnoitia besnoiti]|uniref:Methyltransferase n=1 Tax=Besnoitia besnoiti TaxID=94643 RepID=A0A2A9MLX2_BESBE|nr:hypothetical protein BESB_038090 [Besnoitia besnoiti]PFH37351.1 hypothetical protein BESB_038090 [Besnoitia besnoiti]